MNSDLVAAQARLMEVIRAYPEQHQSEVLDQVLDDLVHDCKSAEASSLNNEGWEAQIAYLLESGVSEKEIEEEIRDE